MSSRQDHLIERAAARMREQAASGGANAALEARPVETGPDEVAGSVAAPAPRQAPAPGVAFPPAPPPSGRGKDAGQPPEAVAPGSMTGGDVAEVAVDGMPAPHRSALDLSEHRGTAGVPALPGTPPDIDLTTMEEAGLVVGRSTRTRISEEFRIAVGRIAQVAETVEPGRTRNPVILVTSAKPGEGKTFSTLNLAAVLAQNGPRPVVLMDTDFKQGSLSDLLRTSTRRGLYDLVAGEASDPQALTLTTGVRNLSFLPSGTYLSEAGGTSFAGPLAMRIAAVADAFSDHIIVLDAPPCLSTSDPSTLAAVAGQVLMVVEAGRTQRSEVESALDFVRACPVVTMLLNKVRQTTRQTFGSYDYLSSYQ